MATNQSPIGKTGSSSSIDSVRKEEHKSCFCGRRARVFTSWTLKNPGRRFYTCATPKNNGCHYFEWFAEEFCPRSLDVITHLNHRRIYLEEKLKVVEEDLAESMEKKKLLKVERNLLIEARMKLEAEKNRMKKQMKLCVVVVLIVVLIVSK
ncbi:hypothetical protein DCAR_0831244 [Daucus carota subsp. sativus]|uniref:GRF-type domain-containing protein n=1 Tax=Daucus carota subsp. sativus TaxID=79200 RepID=A0AAF1BBG2_DAUCS|nr:hypothetical protein DCAR_0831244 [Daucus carota subsp. sativus]